MAPEKGIHRPWTLLVYMAGDNGKVFSTGAGSTKLMAEMTSAGYADIWEMAQVGTTPACAVLCLFDSQEAAYLVEVQRGKGLIGSAQRVREVNTGDPAALRDFIVYGVQHYSADYYALVIWNHGTGWLDLDHYQPVRSLAGPRASHPALFRSTLQNLALSAETRPIAFDDSSKDFLDSAGLRQALTEAAQITGRRLDVLGMDACLMAMIEGARQVEPFADYFVASQEVEPMDGWPYAAILQAINRNPALEPSQLAAGIVAAYAAHYGGETRAESTVTQSAIAVRTTAQTEALCKGLVAAVLARGREPRLAALIRRARDAALVFQDDNYRDLGDFARLIADSAGWEGFWAVQTASAALNLSLRGRARGNPVLQVAYRPDYERATGLSVYLPSGGRPAAQVKAELALYSRLRFAQATGWGQLVAWLNDDI